MDDRGFLEVETLMMQPVAGGAPARPFVTHHNALDMEAHLRIAPETRLKRLVVGGYDRAYELARCFRNEGIDPSHLPDFTMLEYYRAWWNYEDNMRFTEKLVKHVLTEATGGLIIKRGDRDINFGESEWPRLSMRELILRDSEIDIDEHCHILTDVPTDLTTYCRGTPQCPAPYTHLTLPTIPPV